MTIGAPRKATPCTVLVPVSRVKTLAMRHSLPNVFRLLIGGRLKLAILLDEASVFMRRAPCPSAGQSQSSVPLSARVQ